MVLPYAATILLSCWANETPQWMESNADVGTALALDALNYSRPKAK